MLLTPFHMPTLSDPQSLNLYAYGSNNPLRFRDLDGHSHQKCTTTNSTTQDPDGTIHVTVSEHCETVADASDFLFAGLAGGVGHHWIPQAYTRNWQPGWAKDIVSKWTSGPLVQNAKANLNDALQRINNAKVTQMVKDYLARTGKTADQLTKEDFQAISNEIKTAGGEVEQFSQRLASETPSARDVEAGLENAFKSVEGAVQEGGGQLIEEGQEAIQECGPACL